MSFDITFQPSGRGKAQCEPNPAFPNGIKLDATINNSQKSCLIELSYPAPECGLWMIECKECGLTLAVTAAGRTEDPISVCVPCKAKP